MDDTAQTSSVQNPQQPAEPGAQAAVNQAPPATPAQPVTRPVEPPPTGSRGPERGPVQSGTPPREAAPIDEADAVQPAASDDSSDVIDDPNAATKAAEAQAPAEAQPEQAIEVQESHPQVEVPEELKEAGVEAGPDSQKDQLPEEKQEIDTQESAFQASPDPKQALGEALPMDYVHAVQLKKTSKIRDSAKWLANVIKRQWEIIQGK